MYIVLVVRGVWDQEGNTLVSHAEQGEGLPKEVQGPSPPGNGPPPSSLKELVGSDQGYRLTAASIRGQHSRWGERTRSTNRCVPFLTTLVGSPSH